MKHFVSALFCFFSLIFLIGASPEHTVLMPISDKGWPGMESRHEKGAERHLVTPQDMEHFVWGSENGMLPLLRTREQMAKIKQGVFANMTLNTGEDELVISMERFAGKL